MKFISGFTSCSFWSLLWSPIELETSKSFIILLFRLWSKAFVTRHAQRFFDFFSLGCVGVRWEALRCVVVLLEALRKAWWICIFIVCFEGFEESACVLYWLLDLRSTTHCQLHVSVTFHLSSEFVYDAGSIPHRIRFVYLAFDRNKQSKTSYLQKSCKSAAHFVTNDWLSFLVKLILIRLELFWIGGCSIATAKYL